MRLVPSVHPISQRVGILRRMAPRRLPDLTPEQVVALQDALLANADALLTSALSVLDLGHVALAQSLAILGLEESGKAIAVHERRIAMAHASEGERFRVKRLDKLWSDHRRKLKAVHRFLVEERYWFDVEPPDREANERALGTIDAWASQHNHYKQRGFYVDLDDEGEAFTPVDVADEGLLRDVIERVHQIGWQLRLGEHIEMKDQSMWEEMVLQAHALPSDSHLADLKEAGVSEEAIEAMKNAAPLEPLNNERYWFRPADEDTSGRPGYEAQNRELERLRKSLDDDA